MKTNSTLRVSLPGPVEAATLVKEAWQGVGASFEQFCLASGLASLQQMMEEDASLLAGERHDRSSDKPGYRWGRTRGRIGFHGGTVAMERPRVRGKAGGGELVLPGWQEAVEGGWLQEWAMNLMLINVATRKFARATRLPDAAVPAGVGSGLSKPAVSRRFKALTQTRLAEWMSSDLSGLDLPVIQIDGLHLDDHLLMIAAVGVDAPGIKHPLAVVEGATGNAATVQALLDNLIERGLDPAVCRLFIVDGAKALTKPVPSPSTSSGHACRRGDPPDLWWRHPDPALPGSQGPQHH